MNIADLRRQYTMATLNEADVASEPLAQFSKWFDEAQRADVAEPNAMTLATASASGAPSARVVLLKGFDKEGFVFFTDFRSQKGCELAENPRAALVFLWHELERQVRVEGTVRQLPRERAEAYFRTRPEGSRLGAWASVQSSVLSDRKELERATRELAERFQGGEIPLPPHWGGYCVSPQKVEFWQGRPDRLHDRISYLLTPEQGWATVRLSP